MKNLKRSAGFTLIEVIVSTAVFALFAVGIYSAFQMVLKAVYKSRINIIETALLDEYLEVARNLPFSAIGTINGVPVGVFPQSTTTYRNGIPFQLTITVRSIDDPFDGVLGGTPNDTAPADYKLVELTAKCLNCAHQTQTVVSTMIPPRDLEGDTENGAIFIYVTDASNNPVAGANVRVTNTTSPHSIIINDVTDNNGYLRIVDTPTSTRGYGILVTKDGYSSDFTMVSSTENPDPTKMQLTVSQQQITESYFSIAPLGSLSVHTLDESCEAVPNTSFVMSGEKLIGNPDLRKYSKNLQTDAEGNLVLSDLEFDTYSYLVSGGFDIAGSIPIIPLGVIAGGHKDLSLILAPHTNNSLLVKVLDNSNNLPLSDATVKLTKAGFSSTLKTNYGNLSQTDWSGGSGQTTYDENFPNMYDNSFGVDAFTSPGNILLTEFAASQYVTDGMLESPVFDIGKKVNLLNVLFSSESWPVETGEQAILFQLAVSNSSTSPDLANFVGPDGTASSYYSSTSTIIYTGGQTYRYFRYKAYLHTNDQNFTPVLSNFSITFTSGCTPPGQVFFRGVSAGVYDLEVSATGYDTSSTTIDISGQSSSTVNMYLTI